MERKSKSSKIIMGLCLGILIIFMLGIILRFATRQIVRFTGADNAFTRLVFTGTPELGLFASDAGDEAASGESGIDWEGLYPFDESIDYSALLSAEAEAGDERLEDSGEAAGASLLSKYTSKVSSIEEMAETFATDYLFGYYEMVEAANSYDSLISWNYTAYSEYNGIVELSDEYLTTVRNELPVHSNALSIEDLEDYCSSLGIDFSFIIAPAKICKYDDMDISGVSDFTNQNADALYDELTASGVDVLDLRENIHEEDLQHHSLFYVTDHHWKTTTGLLAAKWIAQHLNEKYDLDYDLSLLDPDTFDYETYEDCFLGSQGKKVTLTRTTPDDFTLLYPKYETLFHYRIPSGYIDLTGNYSVCYDMTKVGYIDYYNLNQYAACNYADNPLTLIENELNDSGKKILFVHESFGNCVYSLLALGTGEVQSIDLRFFTGSLKTYISSEEPDIVVVMYNAGTVGNATDYSVHDTLYDFR